MANTSSQHALGDAHYPATHRRLRANAHIRELAASVTLNYRDFIQPLFVDESLSERKESSGMPGIFSETPESVIASVENDIAAGVRKFLLFPVPSGKSHHPHGADFDFAALVVAAVKRRFGADVWLACDLCLCSYTEHGHCGILSADGARLLNNETVYTLAEYALRLAEAGADCIAPSDMSDGRIHAIRTVLDANNFDHVAVMSYASKFASAFYGPFRDVCKSAPSATVQLQGRTTYQLSPFNLSDALASAERDITDGADIIMVKPAVPYLDIVTRLSERILAPLAVYHVSGEYAAIELLAREGLIERRAGHLELWTSFKRAGASIVISYAAREARGWIQSL